METLGITVRYRPIRIGWCIRSDDYEALQEAWQLSFTMWGGCYNPVIPVDDADYARNLVNLFRVDVLWPLSNDETTKAFIKKFPHLPSSFFPKQFFEPNIYNNTKSATVLDIYHPIHRLYEEHFKNNPNPEFKVALYDWDENDPLSKIWSAMFGKIPSKEITGVDYTNLIEECLAVEYFTVGTKDTCPFNPTNGIALRELGCVYIQNHYSVKIDRCHHGFYLGDSGDFSDLVNYWNLRAAGAQILFIDECYTDRFKIIKLKWLEILRARPKGPRQADNEISILSKNIKERRDLSEFGKGVHIRTVDHDYWNSSNVKAPYMYFTEDSSLATIETSSGRKRISFQLPSKTFTCHRGIGQYLVVSLDTGIGLSRDERVTLTTPYIPGLNDFYSRYYFGYLNMARVEPESIGVISRTSISDLSIHPIAVNQLVEKIFQVSGIVAEPSKPGLIAIRLIQQMGGLQDCRPFKIPGVRDLIESHTPEESFTHSGAIQKIGAVDSESGKPDFASYENLYIEKRKSRGKLKPHDVLTFLLKKSVFSAGLEFDCPDCPSKFWTALNDLSTEVACSFCGHQFNITPYLKDRGDWRFRRSGLFGRDDNQEGAIPVILVLQQLYEVFYPDDMLFTTAMNLELKSSQNSKCETDFVVVVPNYRDEKIQIAIGECKTRKDIEEDDIKKLKAVADTFTSDRFEVFVILAKLEDFTSEEIQYASKLNDELHDRVILFTARELEPYCLYERTSQKYDVKRNPNSFKDMADNTYQIYFQNISTDS